MTVFFSRFDTIHERDEQTPHDGIGHPYACIVRQKPPERQSVVLTTAAVAASIAHHLVDRLSEKFRQTVAGHCQVMTDDKIDDDDDDGDDDDDDGDIISTSEIKWRIVEA